MAGDCANHADAVTEAMSGAGVDVVVIDVDRDLRVISVETMTSLFAARGRGPCWC